MGFAWGWSARALGWQMAPGLAVGPAVPLPSLGMISGLSERISERPNEVICAQCLA